MWMRRMVKLRQYPPVCLDGLLHVDRQHQSSNKINTLKLCHPVIRISETYTDRYDTKEANYIR